MDGGGRLARSLRSLRPQADLKAAAIGAGILLRRALHRRFAKRPPSRSLTVRLERPQPRRGALAFLERHVSPRLGVAVTSTVLLGSIALGVVKGGHLQEAATAFDDARNGLANLAGFRITSVAIGGRKQLTHDEVLAMGGVTGRSSLLFLDAATLRERLKANPWIADATVQKLYPGQLAIQIVERSAFARWQHQGRVQVIADDGAVLEPYVARRFRSLPLVVGKGADSRAKDFVALLGRYPQIAPQVVASVLVGERRWNLRLSNGIDIRLPDNDVGNALAALTTFDAEERLLSRDIVAVDLRLPDRVTVRLSDEAGKAREELFKDKKAKRKVGDA